MANVQLRSNVTDTHEEGTAKTMIASTTRNKLIHCLNDVDFPASKDDLLATVARTGCDDDTLHALQGLAPLTYTNTAQVLAKINIIDGEDTQEDGEEAAGLRHSHTEPDRDNT